MPTPVIHLICGSTGAGKTTYARRLADDIGGVLFSIDAWMTTLYWMDSPQPLDPAWSLERVDRCNAQIWQTAAEVAGRGVPCILDLGFSAAEQRKRFRGLAEAAGLSARLHYLDVDADERWRRVEARNRAGPDENQLTFAVTREMFDFVETLFEPPSDDEMRAAESVRVNS